MLGEKDVTECPPYVSGKGGFQGLFLSTFISWNDARDFCHNCGGHLPGPRSDFDLEVLEHFAADNVKAFNETFGIAFWLDIEVIGKDGDEYK